MREFSSEVTFVNSKLCKVHGRVQKSLLIERRYDKENRYTTLNPYQIYPKDDTVSWREQL